MKILRLFVFSLNCLTTSFPLWSTVTEARETSAVKKEGLQAVAGTHLVWFAGGHLSVRVQDVPLGDLLDEIAGKGGLTVVRYVALDRRVTLEFYRLSLEEALRRILRHRSFVLEYAFARPRTLWILPQGEERYAAQDKIVERTDTVSSGEGIAQISTLQATLNSGDAEQREEATLELGENGQAQAVAPLTLALADRDEDVREAAVVSLAEIGGAEAVQALAIALRDANPRVREEAVDALGEIGGPMAIVLLEQALADDVKFVRQAASEVLDELRRAAQ
ncbi:MAG: HEAT repeat domain-containing protein [Acidiferrobacterales bacterium]|nr:HEAT repeat domain-containing protein [Acidiferrobacterales bacterium]